MHINKAIARIIGEEAKKWKIHNDSLGVKYVDQEPTKADFILNGNIMPCEITPIYHDYLHDANAALRALVWLQNKICTFIHIGYGGSAFWLHDYSKLTLTKSYCETICRGVIIVARKEYPDLLDYSAIDWGEDED
jgi:hypothetical protein